MQENRKLIIGCPVHNDRISLMEMVYSLLKSTNSFDKIVFIESNSTDGVNEILDELAKQDCRIKVYHANTKTPLEAYNMLFDMAKQENSDLLLTQTDVIFPKLYGRDWLNQMRKLAEMPNVGAIIPLNGGGISGPDYINGFEWLGGWCTYFTKEAIQKIGGYDDKFPNGFGVDIDHTYRLVKSEFRVIKMNYWVDHHQQNERAHDKDPKTEQMKKESADYFKKKWENGKNI